MHSQLYQHLKQLISKCYFQNVIVYLTTTEFDTAKSHSQSATFLWPHYDLSSRTNHSIMTNSTWSHFVQSTKQLFVGRRTTRNDNRGYKYNTTPSTVKATLTMAGRGSYVYFTCDVMWPKHNALTNWNHAKYSKQCQCQSRIGMRHITVVIILPTKTNLQT